MLQDELVKLNNSDEYPMHMPGHKRRGTGTALDAAYSMDITEIEGYDNLYDAHGILRSAMDYAAHVYDCPYTYYLVNGATAGIHISICAVADMYRDDGAWQRNRILMAANCHRSVTAAAKIARIGIDHIEPEMIKITTDSEQSARIWGGISAEELENRLRTAEEEKQRYIAVVITSPTYEGVISDVSVLADICHDHDTILIVDEAHGAHLDLSDRYPDGALKAGADIVIHSTHKTLAAMTQTAILHAQGNLVDITRIEEFWYALQTSSPSYVLMASIDNALHHIKENGAMVAEHLAMTDILRKRLTGVKGQEGLKRLRLLVLEDVCGYKTVKGYDPCKAVVFTSGSGIDGYTLQRILLDDYHIQMELASDDHILGISTYMDTRDGLERFADALLEIDDRLDSGYYNMVNESERGRSLQSYKGMRSDKKEAYAPCIPQ